MGKNIITGLCQRGKTFHWTIMPAGPGGVAQARHFTRELEMEDVVLEDAGLLGEQLRLQCPELSGPVSFALGPERMFLRVMELPAGSALETDDMIRLQMENSSPFPEDQLAVAYEVLRAGEDKYLVLMAGVQKKTIDFIGDMCRHAGLDLRRIDAEVAGWWRLLNDEKCLPDDNSGRHMLFIVDSGRIVLFTLQNGQPVAFKTINMTDDLPPGEYAADLVQEIHAANLTLDVEHGVAPLANLRFWQSNAMSPEIDTALRDELAVDIEYTELDRLPPLSTGIARRMLIPAFQPTSTPAGARAVIDFTPAVWRQAVATRILRRKLALATALALALWLIFMGLFFGGLRVEQKRVRQLEQQLQALKTPADEVRTLQSKVRSFEQSFSSDRLALETLREISRLLPQDAILSSFQFKRGRSVIVRGEAETVDPIYDFKQALDNSTVFKRTDMGSIQPGRRRNVSVQTFQMTSQLPETQP